MSSKHATSAWGGKGGFRHTLNELKTNAHHICTALHCTAEKVGLLYVRSKYRFDVDVAQRTLSNCLLVCHKLHFAYRTLYVV